MFKMIKTKYVFSVVVCLLVIPLLVGAYSQTLPSVVRSTLSSGVYQAGQIIPIEVRFNSPVTVTPFIWNSCGVASTTGCEATEEYPKLTLSLNNGTTTALFATSSSGSSNLVFNYTVGASDVSEILDYASTTSLVHNSVDQSQVTMRDTDNNPVNSILPIPGTSASLSGSLLMIGVTSTSTIFNVSSTRADGTLKTGDNVTIKVFFNQKVVVTPYVWRSYDPARSPRWSVAQNDYPTLALRMDNGTVRYSTYLSGSGGNTLSFRYTVQAGDRTDDLTYAAVDSLFFRRDYLNINNPETGVFYVEDSIGGVKSVSDEDLSLTLPTPGAVGSLSYNKNIKTNTDLPNLVLNGATSLQIPLGGVYTEAGASASDIVDGNLTSSITVTNGVNTNKLGNYEVTYVVSNSAGSQAIGQRTVFVHNNLSGLPVNNTTDKNVNVVVGGGSYYRYQIDNENVSETQSIVASSTISLLDLSSGEHILRVWGRNTGEDFLQTTPYVHIWVIRDSSASSGGAGAGGGSGGSSISSVSSSDVNLLSKEGLVSEVASTSGKVLGAKVYQFNRILRLGSKGDDVKLLQFLLIKQKVGKSALALAKNGITGYYGPMTESAMRDYAKKNQLKPANGILNKFVRDHFQKLGKELNISLSKISSKQ
ncbi:MAG: immunoglobulin-like domain-containing protein [Candidatus Paceibacterota bacterium]|jgi:hypothetical protein